MAVITIAREFGAGGKTLGSIVAEKLGYALIDEEIVEMVAMEANVSPDWVDSVAQETGSGGMLPRLLSKLGPFRKGYVQVAMENKPGYIDGNLYIHLLHKVIPRIASQDNVIILGRGGQYLLADHPSTYHFLMIADLEHRINFMMEHYNLSRKQAQIVVEKQSHRRLNLYRYFGKTDFDHPSLYHMVFNMRKLNMEEAAAAVCQLVSGKAAPSST
ncbi:MAG: AAA family ATPase [Desulfobacterales bacterium]